MYPEGANQTSGFDLAQFGRPNRGISNMPLYRHGDLLVADVDTIPSDSRSVRHLVLAEGELTGHSHRIAEEGSAVLFQTPSSMFLSVTADRATLIHQEHGPIALPRGLYRVWRQREYSPAEVRTVRD
jgi:hypothetical protein